MIGFWILAALLLLAGYAFFLPVLLGGNPRPAVDRRKLNLLLHRQRREELAREVGGAERQDLEEELDRDLLADLTVSDTADAQTDKPGRRSLVLALVIVPVLAVAVYGQLGRPDLTDARAAADPRNMANEADFQATIEKLAQRLKNEPNDLDGWVLLARSLMATGQVDKAVTAYEYALKLAPDNPDVKAMYAQTLAEGNGGDFAGRPTDIITDLLKQHPRHPVGLWLAGLAAAQRGDNVEAAAHWEALKAQLAPDSDDAAQLGRYIAQLQGLESTPVTTARPDDAGGQGAGKKFVRIKVALADELKAKANPGDTVFIFARAASGPPMPLAIVRKQVKDLPIEVTLDDSMAMTAGMNLSAFERLILGARVSKSGQAMPRPGDLQGLSDPIVVERDRTYSIRISQELR
jgi:cytochrome c-type biogenesis protein CcmH